MKNKRMLVTGVIIAIILCGLIICIVSMSNKQKQDSLSAEIAVDLVKSYVTDIEESANDVDVLVKTFDKLEESVLLTDEKYHDNASASVIDSYVKKNTDYNEWTEYKQYIYDTYLITDTIEESVKKYMGE